MLSQTSPLTLLDPEVTRRFGAHVADRVGPGDVLLLAGPIGAGKTHFARALIQHRLAKVGLFEDVPSPTFTLVQTYQADCEIWHADLYRLTDPDELFELGLDGAFDTALCLIEWPDRLGSETPENAALLQFQSSEDGLARQLELSGNVKLARRILEGWNG
ncbi:tRNA threonylcarbamoyladenosine biosynthesis protein TsaE [Thioclava dalianensis]|uniref:tRNA (adenosine(37)-N6)-threonylcarbamoyltransferase complex ATPase subunit type 1 TsaE n=1 Tax=Thioclava dalianensis TaxID=1185766 RepID=UPI000690C8AE|nr:tRNA (adenosine(37)-N6)-threonylcarbamoyltransferase complex ATPase subunit type 1 TsaE [Thioclava dalianensis]SFN33411.1 tRNA threonylcarbamoyladenosine biosynthesis protein TsaE [Thioclava dalianensis]